MLTWFKNFIKTSVLWKLFAGFLTVTIPLYSIGIAAIWVSSSLVTQIAQKSIQEKMYFFMSYLDRELQSVSQMLTALNNDPDLPTYLLLQDKAFVFDKVQSEKNILTKMNIVYYSSSYIDDVFLLLPQSVQQLSLRKGSSLLDADGQGIFERIKKSNTRLERFADSDGMTYTIVFPDVYKVNKRVDYILGVDINQSRILDGLKTLQSDSNLNVFLVENESRRLVVNRALTTLDKSIYSTVINNNKLSPINSVEFEGERYLVQVSSSSDGVLSLVSYVRENDVLAPVFLFKKLFWLFVGCSLLFITFYSFIIFRQIHKPLNKLVHYMKEVEKGNLNISFDRKQGDEFGYVFKQFNKMVKQIKTLIEEVFEKKLQLQKSQLKQLQSQINPHFLFNCFYIGYRMAKEGENENVANLCKYLGDYFRFITKQAHDQIPLCDELRFTEIYLEIQKIRFPTRLHFDIQKDEGVDSVLIPGLTIQPLVENSILHGIDQIDDAGHIEIKVLIQDKNVCIEVIDNGIGLSDSELANLNLLINSNAPNSEHCGLWNVNQRLLNSSKEQKGLLIESRQCGGLKVSFNIPMGENTDVMEGRLKCTDY